MADQTAAPTGGRAWFVPQPSGLVREVSVRNALFYNTAAFIGITVAWAPLFYTLAFVPIGKAFGLTSYAWTAILVGACCVFLGLIFASLATVMPRSGGDYVFTSRLIPKAGPLVAWVESFTLVFASLAVIAFEIPIVLHNTQISGDIIGIGTGLGFLKGAEGWFTWGGTVTGWPGMIAALVVIALILLVVVQPTRRFHRIVTGLGAIGLLSWIVMWVAGLLFVDRASFQANLPKYTDMTAAALQNAAVTGGGVGHGRPAVPDERGPVPIHRIPVLGLYRRRGQGQYQARHPDRRAGRAVLRRCHELVLRGHPQQPPGHDEHAGLGNQLLVRPEDAI